MYEYKAHVIDVYDGDTIRADIDLGFGVLIKNQPLRLYGINAPEMIGEQKTAGTESRDKLRTLILNKDIIIHTFKDSKEKYGRYLAVIFLNEININDWLVENNLAEKKNY